MRTKYPSGISEKAIVIMTAGRTRPGPNQRERQPTLRSGMSVGIAISAATMLMQESGYTKQPDLQSELLVPVIEPVSRVGGVVVPIDRLVTLGQLFGGGIEVEVDIGNPVRNQAFVA